MCIYFLYLFIFFWIFVAETFTILIENKLSFPTMIVILFLERWRNRSSVGIWQCNYLFIWMCLCVLARMLQWIYLSKCFFFYFCRENALSRKKKERRLCFLKKYHFSKCKILRERLKNRPQEEVIGVLERRKQSSKIHLLLRIYYWYTFLNCFK